MRAIAFGLLIALTGFTMGCGKKDKEGGGGGGSGESKTSTGSIPADDKAALQGKWKLAKYDMEDPPSEKENPFKDVIHQVLTHTEITIKENLIAAVVTGEKDLKPRYFTFAINPSKSPKELDLTEADEKGTPKPTKKYEGFDAKSGKMKETNGPPETHPGIYKLEGEMLVVALGMGTNATRPTEFKASTAKDKKDKSHDVIVLYFKKQ